MKIGLQLLEEMNRAEAKAWESLSRYKFLMFGYWAAIWVHLSLPARLSTRSFSSRSQVSPTLMRPSTATIRSAD